MTHPRPNRRFVPQAVLTRSGKINTAGASVNTAVRPVNTAGSKTTVNHPRPISNAYKKGYSQVTKPFNKATHSRRRLQVQQKEDGIFISQDKYVAEILKKFDFATLKTASTPMEPNKALVKDEEADSVDVHLYRSMIGSLMYLTTSRLDITFAVCACARFQVTPKTSHLYAVKRIFRYLKGQPKLGLWYPRDSPFDLEAFSDSDYAGASLDKKSTTGGCQFLGKRLISWQCKKQIIVANSTTEAEYVAAANCYGQVLWIQNQMLDYGFNFMNTKIYIDNESTICIVKNPVFHSKTKHIEIRHHFIKDSYEKRLIHVFNDGFDGCIGLKMLFGLVLRVKHEVLSQVTTAAASQPPKDPNTYRRTKRGQNTKVPQSGGSPNKVGDEAINEEMFDSVERAATTASSLESEQAIRSGPWCQETIGGMQGQTRSKGVSNLSSNPPLLGGHRLRSGEDNMEHQIELMDNVPNTPHDSPLLGVNTPGSDKGSLELNELMDLVTKLSHRVFDLEKLKTTQAKEIAEVVKGNIGADDTEVVKGIGDTKVFDTEKAVNTAGEGVSTASVPETVSTAAPRTPPTTTTVFDDEDVTMAMAQTLIKMKEEKAKEKGVVIKNVEDSSRPVRSITTLQPLPTIDPKDKGKGILQETKSVEKTKKKVQGDAQIERDAEVALRLQAELDEELKARMDADYELGARMTQEEQEKYTIKERAGLLVEFFEMRKKQLAVKRTEAIRNKPPTKTQLRNLMMTYLKNMGGYKHSHLKGKSYEEIQGLYERQQKRIQDFTPMDSVKEAQNPGKRLRRVTGSYATQKSPKKPKVMKFAKDVTEEEAAEYEKEKEELRIQYSCFIDGTPMEINILLEKKYPLIKEFLEKMLNLKLEAEEKSTMAFEHIKFIKSLLEETFKLDEGQAGSDPGKTPESQPSPEHKLIEEDQAGSNPRQNDVALVGLNPEPIVRNKKSLSHFQ
ncbi:hypothetical protein Tco_0071715 [Tanacetum coccineum]